MEAAGKPDFAMSVPVPYLEPFESAWARFVELLPSTFLTLGIVSQAGRTGPHIFTK